MAHSVPSDIAERIKRGRQPADRLRGRRELCQRMVRGEQYLYLTDQGSVFNQNGNIVDRFKQGDHRVRQVRNLIQPIVREKVSLATSRVPGYEVNPTSMDYEDQAAANIASNVLLAGYDQWDVHRAIKELIWYAVVTDQGFLMSYWDTEVGPFVEHELIEEVTDTETGEVFEQPTGEVENVGVGDVRLRAFSGSSVFWEKGVPFNESRWHATIDSRPMDRIKAEPGFIEGIELQPDSSKDGAQLVEIIDYFERPSSKFPKGRRFTTANDQVIFEPEHFPLSDHKGNVIDEPPMVRLAFDIDPEEDSDQGLVWSLIDAQRSYNDVHNRLSEWKNLALVPQMLAPKGSVEKRPTDNPGDVIEYETAPGQEPPQFRNAPAVPQELFQMLDRAKADMEYIAAAQDVPPESVRSATEAQTIIDKSRVAWGSFIVDLAKCHSRIARDNLCLVQRYYTEERTLTYKGRLGWESVPDFKGANIRGQTDVRVLPSALEPRTKAAVEQRIMNYAQLGWVDPQSAISAIESGMATDLIDRFDDEVGRVHRIIMRIKNDPDSLLNGPMRPAFPGEDIPDPETGMPMSDLPAWMPRPFDNAKIQKGVMEQWFKTQDYESATPESQEVAHLYYDALMKLEFLEAQREAEMQMAQAQQMGMNNAAKPAGDSPNPSLPSTISNNGQG